MGRASDVVILSPGAWAKEWNAVVEKKGKKLFKIFYTNSNEIVNKDKKKIEKHGILWTVTNPSSNPN